MPILVTILHYLAEHKIDPVVVARDCGWLAIMTCAFDGRGGFSCDYEGGVDAAMIPVLDAGRRFSNYCAWPIDQPDSVATDMPGETLLSPLLGEWNLHNPASWAFGERLMVHRTPLRWLKAGCRGVVVLDHKVGFLRLREALGPLEAEDEEHARILHTLINPQQFELGIWVPM